jgi:hypothetical protein
VTDDRSPEVAQPEQGKSPQGRFTPPPLQLFYGGGDMIALLDDLRERVARGEIDGIVISAASANMCCGWSWAWKDDAVAPWARMLAAVDSAQAELVNRGL